jgi:hypothetical protein
MRYRITAELPGLEAFDRAVEQEVFSDVPGRRKMVVDGLKRGEKVIMNWNLEAPTKFMLRAYVEAIRKLGFDELEVEVYVDQWQPVGI